MCRLLSRLMLVILLGVCGVARASLIVTVTENAAGGTNWAFSGGTGTIAGGGGMCCFLPGATSANPQNFLAASDEDFSLSVLAGTDPFGFTAIFIRNYGGLSGSNGSIFNGVDFQTSILSLGGMDLADLNGLVLYADDFSISSLNVGTYAMDSYFDGQTNYAVLPGIFTLVVVASVVPEPGTLALVCLAGLAAARRRKQ